MRRTKDVTKMTRNEVLDRLYDMAKRLSKKFDRTTYDTMWTMCCDWNSAHYDGTWDEREIFMCEDWDDDDNFRYYIEDDYFYLAD